MKSIRKLEFIALLLGSVFVARHALVTTLRLALQNDAYTHILLILPVSIALIYVDRKSLRVLVDPDRRHGSLIAGTAAIIAVSSFLPKGRISSDLQLSLDILALVIWCIGSFILCFGTRTFRLARFPLLLLFWIVPLPSFALDRIIALLQQGSALAARLLFEMVAIPVAQNGLVLSIPGLVVEVAKACSSIRSSLMLLVTTIVLAQLLLKSSFHKGLVIVLAIPLAIAKNGLRIFTIAMLATKVDPTFLTGEFHQKGGIVFFTIALLCVFVLLRILAYREEARKREAWLVTQSW